jgi:serine/threonine protein kinase SCH9
MAFTDNYLSSYRPIEDDGNDNIDSDTPRSGIATPRPDPSDKRLPGIMHSYFGQVGSSPSPTQGQPSGMLETPVLECETLILILFNQRESTIDGLLQLDVPGSVDESLSISGNDGETSPHMHEQVEMSSAQPRGLHPYPAPSISEQSSLQRLDLCEPTLGDKSESRNCLGFSSSAPTPPASRNIASGYFPSKSLTAAVLNPLSNIVTTSNVYATHFSVHADRSPAAPSTPYQACFTSSSFPSDLASYGRLKKLTDDVDLPREKSNPPTPTRALSNQTASSDASGGSDHINGNGKTSTPGTDVASASASYGSDGAPVKIARGKLTVKIGEARGLRRSKDPYVVAVFQRNELVSKGPRSEDDEDDEDNKIPMGGIPISRQGSDSGRPMAIPMKSRQSSSTSLTEHRDFKMKARKPMINPKWDTEAVL